MTKAAPNIKKSKPKKKHHYIPVAYLKRFVSPSECLWVYNKNNSEVFEEKPEAIAYENDYFTFINENGQKDSETLENLITDMENETLPVIKKILNKQSLTDSEMITFSFFVALMQIRAPNFRDNVGEAFSGINKKILQMLAADEKAFERSVKAIEEKTGKTIGMPFEEYRKTVLHFDKNFEMRMNPQVGITTSLSLLKKFARIFKQMHWGFFEASDENKFITGDNPFNYIDPSYKRVSFYGYGLGNKNIEVTLPLSKDICAFGSWKLDASYYKADNQLVKEFNRRTASASWRFIFSSLKSEGLRSLATKYKDSQIKIKVG
ncbi:MAG: DUF4238 domain-containing protein [Chlamydiae bacterium]|nr:DUF4238 domain-containing protein [Chlamydiota bacterium]MBI3265631.1 DUF4238 domain-containing protein [Chlamydiota bacterium]